MSKKNHVIPQFEDHHQNFWQLSVIQSSSLGLPWIFLGVELAKNYGCRTAFLGVCIGNLILWILGISIISMTFFNRKNAVENVQIYLGRNFGIAAGLIVIVSVLIWYVFQIKLTTIPISDLLDNLNIRDPSISIRLGSTLGFIVALLSIGGIRLIKWLCVFAFPFQVLFIIYALISAKNSFQCSDNFGEWSFSLVATVAPIVYFLPGIMNLPTFFRHSRSRQDSILALSLMVIFFSFFESFAIFWGVNGLHEMFSANFLYLGKTAHYILTSAFIFVSYLCANLVNVYIASAGWGMVLPHLQSSKELAIIGLVGTVAYAFLQVSPPMEYLRNSLEFVLANLAFVLTIAFLIKMIVQHRPRPLEKHINGACWLLGSLVSLLLQATTSISYNKILFIGVGASIISFIIIFLIEETTWSIKQLAKD